MPEGCFPIRAGLAQEPCDEQSRYPGFWSGTTAVFVRFSGCNLDCPWCDTKHDRAVGMTGVALRNRIVELLIQGDRIVLTGGEPTLQLSAELLKVLVGLAPVAVETNGTIFLPRSTVVDDLWITYSPKSPEFISDFRLDRIDEIKIVGPTAGWTPTDLDDALALAKAYYCKHFFLQPEDGAENDGGERWVKENVLASREWRAGARLHKTLGCR